MAHGNGKAVKGKLVQGADGLWREVKVQTPRAARGHSKQALLMVDGLFALAALGHLEDMANAKRMRAFWEQAGK